MESIHDVIVSRLIEGGYTAKEAEELIMDYMEEQRALDELRDNLHCLNNE